jgi:outer membrane protein with beta-barrel domain
MTPHRLVRLLFLVGLVAAPTRLIAQVQFGIKGGASFGNISNKGVLPGDLKTRTGFAAGVSVGFGAQLLGIGAEALFAQRGLSSDGIGGAKLDYLDIPVYLKLQVPSPGIAPFGYLGPQVSFEVNCSNGDLDCSDNGRSTTDYAGVIGAGVKFGGGSKVGVTVEARYVYGLKDLKLDTVTSDDSFKTRSFLILGGLVF